MTCKDCKHRRKCKDKVYERGDVGETWAEWCDDFQSRKKVHTVTYKGIVAGQSEVNYHINMFYEDTGDYFAHLSCTKHLSKRELKRDIKLVKNSVEGE